MNTMKEAGSGSQVRMVERPEELSRTDMFHIDIEVSILREVLAQLPLPPSMAACLELAAWVTNDDLKLDAGAFLLHFYNEYKTRNIPKAIMIGGPSLSTFPSTNDDSEQVVWIRNLIIDWFQARDLHPGRGFFALVGLVAYEAAHGAMMPGMSFEEVARGFQSLRVSMAPN